MTMMVSTHTHTHAHTRMHTHVHACTHTHTHTQAHTHMYTHARTHTHTHTDVRIRFQDNKKVYPDIIDEADVSDSPPEVCVKLVGGHEIPIHFYVQPINGTATGR